MCAGLRQHADVELALMQAIPAMAYDASCLPYVNRVLDQLCPPGESCFIDCTGFSLMSCVRKEGCLKSSITL